MKNFILLLAVMIGLNTTAFGFATLATTFKGGDAITFNSNVNDVVVLLNGAEVGRLNGSFIYKVQRDGLPKVFTFKKEGYKQQQITLTTTFDNLFWGNLLFGGAFGSSTDSWFTKNSMQYSPNQYYVSLKKG